MRLRENWGLVQKYSHHIDLGIAFLVVAGTLWFFVDRYRAARRRAAP
jgi:hypothetical protein